VSAKVLQLAIRRLRPLAGPIQRGNSHAAAILNFIQRTFFARAKGQGIPRAQFQSFRQKQAELFGYNIPAMINPYSNRQMRYAGY